MLGEPALHIKAGLKVPINSVSILNTFNLWIIDPEENCNIFCRPKMFFVDFFAVKVVTGSDVKVGTNGKGIVYSSIWHVFRIKNSLRNRGNTKNNEKVIYFSVANSFLPKACLL